MSSFPSISAHWGDGAYARHPSSFGSSNHNRNDNHNGGGGGDSGASGGGGSGGGFTAIQRNGRRSFSEGSSQVNNNSLSLGAGGRSISNSISAAFSTAHVRDVTTATTSSHADVRSRFGWLEPWRSPQDCREGGLALLYSMQEILDNVRRARETSMNALYTVVGRPSASAAATAASAASSCANAYLQPTSTRFANGASSDDGTSTSTTSLRLTMRGSSKRASRRVSIGPEAADAGGVAETATATPAAAAAAATTTSTASASGEATLMDYVLAGQRGTRPASHLWLNDDEAAAVALATAAAASRSSASSLPPSATSSPIAALTPGTLAAPATYHHRTRSGGRWGAEGEGAELPRSQRGSGAGLAGWQPASATNRSGHSSGLASANLSTLASEPPVHAPAAAAAGAGDGVVAARTVNAAEESHVAAGGEGDTASPPGFAMTLPRVVSTPTHAAAPSTSTAGAAAAAAAASGKIPTVAPLRVVAPLATPPLVPAIPHFDALRMEQEVLRQQHQLLQQQHPHPRSEAAQRRQRALMHSDDDDGASADGDEDEDAYGNAAASSNSHNGPGWECDQTARPGVSRAPPQQGAAVPASRVPSAHLQPPNANSNVSISDGDGVGGYRHGQGAAPVPAAAASAGAGVTSEPRLRHDDAAGLGDYFSGDSDDVVDDEGEDDDEDDRFSETNFDEGGHLACVPGDSLHQRYTLLKPLGVGRSSRVWLAVDSEQCSLARRQLIHQLGEREVRRLFRPAERPLFVAIKVFRCDAMYADCAMYEAKLSTFVKESVRRRLSLQQQHQSYQEHASRRPNKVDAGTDSLPASPTTAAAAAAVAAYAVPLTAALATARGSSPTHGAPQHHHNDSAHVEGGSSTPPPRPQGGTSSAEAPALALRPRRRSSSSSTQSGTGLSASSVGDAVRTFSDRLTTFRDAFTVEGAYGTHHCLVMDVLGAGVDAAINEAHLSGFPSAIARSILRASLQGLSVLAACHLIHTDLKPENLLFTDLEPTIAAEMRRFQAAQLHTSARGELWSSFTHRRESLQHYARRVQQERAAVASGAAELVEGAVGDGAEGRDLDHHSHPRHSRHQCRGRRAAYEVRVSDFGLSFIVPPCLRRGVRALTAHVEATGDSGSAVEDELVRQDPVAQLRWLYTQQQQQRSSESTPVTPAIITTGSSAPGAAALPGHLGEAASPPPLLSPTSPPAALGLCVLDDVLEDAELQALEALEEARHADADEDDVLLDFGRDGLLLRVPGMPLNAIDAHERARASRHGGSEVEGSGVEEAGEGNDVDDDAEEEAAGFVSVRDVGIGAAACGTRIAAAAAAAAASSSSGSAGGRRRWLREPRHGAPLPLPPPPHVRAALAEATDSGVLPPPTLRTASYHSPVANSLTASANFRFGAAGGTPWRDDASSGHDSASPRDDVRERLVPALHAGTPAPTSLTMPLRSAHVSQGLVETDDVCAVAVAPDAHLEKAHRRRSSSSSEGGEAQGDVRHSTQEAEPRRAPGQLTRVPRIDGGAASPAALALRRLECHIIRNQRYTRGVVIQSREYRAPEVLLGAFFLPSCDVWSIGCIAYELVTGRFLLDCIADRERFAAASAWQQAQRSQVQSSNTVNVKSADDDDGEEHQQQQEPVPAWDGQPIYLDDTEQDLDVFHLKAMMRLLGPPPLSYLQQRPIGLYVDDFFDERGDFRFWEPGEAEEAGMTLAEPYRRRAAAETQERGQRPQLASQHSTQSSRSPVPAQHERISVQTTAATDNTWLTETEGDACASQQPSLTDAAGPREEPLSIHSRQVPTTEVAGIGHSGDTGGAAAAAATPMTTAVGPSPSATPSSLSVVTPFASSHSVPRVSATTGAAATTRGPPPHRETDPAASAAARRGACDTCNYPVSTPDWQDVQAILRDKLGTAEEAADFERFLQRCLQWDPAQRATAAALLVDDWVVKYGSVLADAVMRDDDGSVGEGNA